MVFENIEKLKQEYTDKYVVVDGSRPELMRFRDLTGQIKTVNMSGRALVEFDGENIGWHDIEVDFLKVVDKPAPKEKAPAKKTAPKKPAAKAPAKAAAKPAAKAGGGMSVDDILAAARGGTAAPAKTAPAKTAPAKTAPAKTAAPAIGAMSVEDVLAAARGGTAPSSPSEKTEQATKPPSETKKGDAKQMSVADVLAAARGQTGLAPAAASPPATEGAAAETTPQSISEAEPEAEAEPSKAAAADGQLPTEVADVIEFCRQRDA